jgi:hypothetical protein
MSENGGPPLRSATITGLATARSMLRPLGFTRDRLATLVDVATGPDSWSS